MIERPVPLILNSRCRFSPLPFRLPSKLPSRSAPPGSVLAHPHAGSQLPKRIHSDITGKSTRRHGRNGREQPSLGSPFRRTVNSRFVRAPSRFPSFQIALSGCSTKFLSNSEPTLGFPGYSPGSSACAAASRLSLRKEVIQPHLPVLLPCYDFVPVIRPTLGSSLLAVESPTSGVSNSHDVTGGVYKARERIQRSIADLRLLATPASCRRVAACNLNYERL